MQTSIASFNNSTLAVWNGSKPAVTFSAHLSTANSNSGATILTPANFNSMTRELGGLKAMGAKGVVVNIDYPVLDAGFDAYGGQSAAYLTFYQGVASAIRASGLKLIVETGAIFSDPVFSPLNVSPYYNSLSLNDYMNGRASQAALIATQLQPDYLNVLQEPDTEAMQSGKPEVYTLPGSLNLLNTILTSVKATGATMPIGAGIGPWLPNDVNGKTPFDYINGYAAIANLDSIDIHIYPVIRDFLSRMNTIATIAKNAGKKLTISEAWAYKVRDSEFNSPFYPSSVIYGRDVFSFWAQLDTQFLQAITNWSYYQHVDYMAAFWSQNLRAYIIYDSSTQTLPPSDLFNLRAAAAGTAITTPSVSTTGSTWYNLIMNPADVTPPTAPVVTSTVYPTQIVLNLGSSDDTGIYKYTIARQGVTSVTTIENNFQETGLANGKCYVYTVTAFDFKNNKTATTLPSVCTNDTTPPTPPTSTTVTAGGVVQGTPVTSSMRIAWSGATDNTGQAGIGAYHIYRSVAGGPFNYLTKVTASPLNYTDSGLQQSNTTYCYQIKTQDLVLLLSDFGPSSCATTKDWQAPTVPSGVTGANAGTPNINISWNASTDGVGVFGYDIQKRKGTAGAFGLLQTGIQNTNFLDTDAAPNPDNVAPTVSVSKPASGSTITKTLAFSAATYDVGVGTTYMYQVRATDATGNKSAWGSPAVVTLPKVGGVLASVAFFVDGVQLGVLTSTPYYIVWDSRTATNGSHTFTIKATDTAGNSSSATVVANVAN
ncbi:MAG: Ig-like domain-containing protein [Bryobacteraceae bacterium]